MQWWLLPSRKVTGDWRSKLASIDYVGCAMALSASTLLLVSTSGCSSNSANSRASGRHLPRRNRGSLVERFNNRPSHRLRCTLRRFHCLGRQICHATHRPRPTLQKTYRRQRSPLHADLHGRSLHHHALRTEFPPNRPRSIDHHIWSRNPHLRGGTFLLRIR